MKLSSTHYILGAAFIVIAGFIVWGVMQKGGPGPADALARCLTEKGVKMYGAYWCPHCQAQKKAFGNSWQYITYIECALPGGQGQTKECTDAGIKGYPTWVFPGGARMSGELSFSILADKAGCAFTQGGEALPPATGEGMDTAGNIVSSPTSTESVPASE